MTKKQCAPILTLLGGMCVITRNRNALLLYIMQVMQHDNECIQGTPYIILRLSGQWIINSFPPLSYLSRGTMRQCHLYCSYLDFGYVIAICMRSINFLSLVEYHYK